MPYRSCRWGPEGPGQPLARSGPGPGTLRATRVVVQAATGIEQEQGPCGPTWQWPAAHKQDAQCATDSEWPLSASATVTGPGSGRRAGWY